MGNGTPMLWAGATSKDTWNNAAFRVYNSGHVDMGDVSITSAGADGRLTLSEGDIMLSKSSGATTSLTSKAMGSLSAALGKAGGDSVDYTAKVAGTSTTVSFDGKSYGGRANTDVTIGIYTAAATETIKLFTAPFTGKCTVKATASGSNSIDIKKGGIASITKDGDIIAAGSTAASQIAVMVSSIGTLSMSIVEVYKNGTKISGTTSFDVEDGATYTAKVSYSNTVTPTTSYNRTGSDYSSYAFNIVLSGAGGVTAGGSLALHLVSTTYINKYYADGYMLFQNTGSTEDTLRYAGMTSADATVMQMRSGSSLLKFTADGLMQSLNGGTTFYRANPLICSFKLVYNSATATGYEYLWIFNPKGMAITKVAREAAGNILISHTFGLGANYYPQGAYVCTGNTEYSRTLMFDNIGSTSLRVHIMTGNNHYDPQNTGGVDYCLIYIYDFKTY